MLVPVLERILRIHFNFSLTYLHWHPNLTPNRANIWQISFVLLFKTQKIEDNSVAAGWYQTICLSASSSHLFRWKFRIQYCKTESGYNFVCWYVCTEGLVSLHTFCATLLTRYLLWQHINSRTSQSGPQIHFTKSLILSLQIKCRLR
jgi:hypothetical protein